MMTKTPPANVCIVQGHPHGGGKHFCHALADAYAAGVRDSGAKVKRIDLGNMDVPLLRDPADFATPPNAEITAAQRAVTACDHLVVIYPLWLGTMPAVVKAFFEQLSRANFAIAPGKSAEWPRQMLKGRSARVIVTMGMPAAAYKLIFGAHGVRGFESGILGMSGISPIRETLIGGAGELTPKRAASWLSRVRRLGQLGS
ncbi:MAG: NAD(P)H-dependent oxidoreductase [Hyphomonadaceae bacterium]